MEKKERESIFRVGLIKLLDFLEVDLEVDLEVEIHRMLKQKRRILKMAILSSIHKLYNLNI